MYVWIVSIVPFGETRAFRSASEANAWIDQLEADGIAYVVDLRRESDAAAEA